MKKNLLLVLMAVLLMACGNEKDNNDLFGNVNGGVSHTQKITYAVTAEPEEAPILVVYMDD